MERGKKYKHHCVVHLPFMVWLFHMIIMRQLKQFAGTLIDSAER